MKSGWVKKSLCLACLGLSVVLTVVGTGQTEVGGGQRGTLSIMERVQRVDDPELAELIRTALANHKNISERDALDIVRRVTQSYAQTKLLDQQIAQVTRKIESTTGPAEMRYELLLAKTELELKRTTELANLREAMGVIPRFPFERKPVETLNAWLRLNMVDQRVYVTDTLKPFNDDWAKARFQSLGLLSEKETLDCVGGRLRDRKSLPIRIDICYRPETKSASERLRDAIVSLARETNADMDTEVRSDLLTWIGSGTCTFFLRGGEIRTLYPRPVQRPDRASRYLDLATGRIAPNDLEQHILWRLMYPGNVPLTFRIEYDEASTKVARQIGDMVKAVAKRLGIGELVEVAGTLVEPVPETAFLGRWQAITKGEVQTMDVQPGGVCLLTMSEGLESIQAGPKVSCPWLPTTKEIIVDVKQGAINRNYFAYRGYLNAEGNLVVNRGVIYPQGSFQFSTPSPMVFRKAQ